MPAPSEIVEAVLAMPTPRPRDAAGRALWAWRKRWVWNVFGGMAMLLPLLAFWWFGLRQLGPVFTVFVAMASLLLMCATIRNVIKLRRVWSLLLHGERAVASLIEPGVDYAPSVKKITTPWDALKKVSTMVDMVFAFRAATGLDTRINQRVHAPVALGVARERERSGNVFPLLYDPADPTRVYFYEGVLSEIA